MAIKMGKPKGLTAQILIAMVIGAILGLILNFWFKDAGFTQTFLINGLFYAGGKIFVSFLKLLVVPLVFVSLVCGTAALDDITKLGRVGTKTIGLYLLTTAVAVILAIIAALVLQPGAGFDLTTASDFTAKTAPSVVETIIDMFPTNPFAAMVEGKMLQVIVFSGLLGIALTLSGSSGKNILKIFEDLNEVIMKMVMMIMKISPYGVFCLIAKVFSEQGFEAFEPLLKYFFVVLAVLIFHGIFIYGSMIKFMARLSPYKFFANFKEVPIFAFSTSSSGATIPVTLEAAEKKLGIDNSIASFTIPLGATINMDGTAIMQGVATIFIAQAYGIHLSIGALVSVVLTATLASVGTAGVPGVGLITLSMVLNQVGLPVEGVGVIMAVDRLLDMTRTAVNVTGDAAVSLIVAKSENQFDQKIFDDIPPFAP